jgi:hypothetical protein
MNPTRAIATAALLAGFLPASLAADPSAAPVEMIDEVVVPVPREIFAALDELGAVNWGGLVRQPEFTVQADRNATALIFGVVIAEGFIAVQAKDEEATKKLGPKVLELSELLGVKDAVNAHAKAIVDSADGGDWEGVRRELDRTQATVRSTMKELRDEDLAHFVSMGGWLRGTEAAASAVAAAYDADKSELLHQPGLVAHFRKIVGGLDEKAGRLPAFKRIHKDLPQLEAAMREEPVSPASVQIIHSLCAGMVKEVLGKDPEAKGGNP